MAIYPNIKQAYQNAHKVIDSTRETLNDHLVSLDSFMLPLIEHAIYPTEELFLYVLLKKFNRQKKRAPSFISTTLELEELQHFMDEYSKLPFYLKKDSPIFIVVNDQLGVHRFFIMVETDINNTINILFFSTCYSKDYILDILGIVGENTNIYCYHTQDEVQWPKISGKIQSDGENCSWFSLEMCFTLSKQSLPLKKLQTYSKPTNKKNVKFLYHKNLPVELASVFRSCQSTKLFNDLEENIKASITSSKGHSLIESINRRSALAFRKKYPTQEFFSWPNKLKDKVHINHAITYFRDRQIEKLASALSNPEFIDFVVERWAARTDATKLLMMK